MKKQLTQLTSKMKVIIKAMNDIKYRPRKGWWGFVKDDKRYLCRYNHVFIVFSENEILFKNYETTTDKAGVNFAINYFQQKLKKNGI